VRYGLIAQLNGVRGRADLHRAREDNGTGVGSEPGRFEDTDFANEGLQNHPLIVEVKTMIANGAARFLGRLGLH
jgi:hypothetical protein